jgi:hypothetical protein
MVETSTVRIAIEAATEAAENGLNEVEQELEEVGEAGDEAASGANNASGALGKLRNRAEGARDRLSSMGRSMKRVGRQATLGVTLPLGAAAAKSLQLASNAEEMQSKMSVVFGDLQGDVEEWASTHAEEINRSRFQLQKYATSLQDTFVPMGFAREEATKMSKEMAELAVDLASFNNVSESRAINSLQSGLVGSHEALREFGIVITNSRLKLEAYNEGIAEQGEELTEQQKLLARYSLIMKDSADAQGDAARTADSFKNQLRGLKAQLKEAGIIIGNVLMPVVSDLMDGISPLLDRFTNLNPAIQRAIVVFGGLAAILPPLLFVFGAMATTIAAISTPVLAVVGAVALLTGAIVAFLPEIKAVMNELGVFENVLKPLADILIGVAKDSIQFVAEQLEYLADAIKPPAQAMASELQPTLEAISPVLRRIKVGLAVLAGVAKAILLPIVRAMAGAFRVLLANAIEVIIGYIRILMALMRGDFGEAFKIAKEVVVSSLGRIKDFVLSWGLIEAFVDVLTGVYEAAKSFIFETIPQVFAAGIDAILQKVRDAKADLENAFVSVWNGIIGLTENFINGIIGRIETLVNSWVAGLNTVIDAANNIPKVDVGEIGDVNFSGTDLSGARLDRRQTGGGSSTGGMSASEGGGETNIGEINVNAEGGDFGEDPERNSRELADEMQREIRRSNGAT